MRTINADGVKLEIKKWQNTKDDFRTLKQIVDSMPTIDAVPVVRCKDCEHWQQSVDGITKWCSVMRGRETKYDDFCSYGERRDENATD